MSHANAALMQEADVRPSAVAVCLDVAGLRATAPRQRGVVGVIRESPAYPGDAATSSRNGWWLAGAAPTSASPRPTEGAGARHSGDCGGRVVLFFVWMSVSRRTVFAGGSLGATVRPSGICLSIGGN